MIYRTPICLAVADGAVHERINSVFFDVPYGPVFLVTQLLSIDIELFWVPLPIEFRNTINGTQMRIRLAVAANTPSHGQFLCLVNRLHLIDPTVARFATHAGIHVGGMVEVDKRRQVVNTCPRDTPPQIPTLTYRPKLHAGRMNRSQRSHTFIVQGTVAIDARRGWRHCGVGSIEHRVVAITTVQLQLAGMDRMAKGDGLSWLIADIQGHRVGNQPAHGTRENNARSRCYRKNTQEWINPTRKQKPLHDLFGRRSARSPVPH